jgi:hypothetical protein
MNNFELYLVEPLSVTDDIFIGLVEIVEFRSGIFDIDLFIRVDKFGFSSICSPYLKV